MINTFVDSCCMTLHDLYVIELDPIATLHINACIRTLITNTLHRLQGKANVHDTREAEFQPAASNQALQLIQKSTWGEPESQRCNLWAFALSIGNCSML